MAADFTGTQMPIFCALVEADEEVFVKQTQGSTAPLKLCLALRHYPKEKHALADILPGAILELDMRWEDMALIYARILQFARQKGLPLPE